MSQIDIKELTERKTQESFPNILITNPNEAVPVVVRTLEKGDMQLIMEYNGARKVVAKISRSALNVHKLIRVLNSVEYFIAPGSSITINEISDYLSCIN